MIASFTPGRKLWTAAAGVPLLLAGLLLADAAEPTTPAPLTRLPHPPLPRRPNPPARPPQPRRSRPRPPHLPHPFTRQSWPPRKTQLDAARQTLAQTRRLVRSGAVTQTELREEQVAVVQLQADLEELRASLATPRDAAGAIPPAGVSSAKWLRARLQLEDVEKQASVARAEAYAAERSLARAEQMYGVNHPETKAARANAGEFRKYLDEIQMRGDAIEAAMTEAENSAARALGPAVAPTWRLPLESQLKVIEARKAAKQAELEATRQIGSSAESAKEAALTRVKVATLEADWVELSAQADAIESEIHHPSKGGPSTDGVPGAPPSAGGGATVAPAEGAASSALPGEAVEGDRDSAADAMVEQKLQKLLPEVQFDAVPLSDVCDFLHDVTGVDFFVDWKVMEAAGVGKAEPITLRAKQIPAAVAIDRVLLSANGTRIGYVIDHGQVYVSTAEQLERVVVTRAYDVSDLPKAGDDLKTVIQRIVAPDSWKETGGSVGTIEWFGQKLDRHPSRKRTYASWTNS